MSSTHNQGHIAPMTDPERVNPYIIRHLPAFLTTVWMAGVERTLFVGACHRVRQPVWHLCPGLLTSQTSPVAKVKGPFQTLEQKQAGRA